MNYSKHNCVIVHPMTSYSGSVAYLEYVAKTDKGDVKKGDLFNGVFGLGGMTEARQNYSAQIICESISSGEKVGLTPMATGKFEGGKDAKLVKKSDNSVSYKTAEELAAFQADGDYKVYYFSEEFQMEHVPAQDIPTIGPRMKQIALVAEPRRIAVRYDQITAFQA